MFRLHHFFGPVGENPTSEKNKTVEQYNAILKDIATKQNFRVFAII